MITPAATSGVPASITASIPFSRFFNVDLSLPNAAWICGNFAETVNRAVNGACKTKLVTSRIGEKRYDSTKFVAAGVFGNRASYHFTIFVKAKGQRPVLIRSAYPPAASNIP